MPEEYSMGNHDLYAAIIAKSEAMFSPEGRLSHEGAQNALKVLSAFDPAVAGAQIDLKAAYTNRLAEKASALH
jgi:NitT/TauT family transport system substrate-binding protein